MFLQSYLNILVSFSLNHNNKLYLLRSFFISSFCDSSRVANERLQKYRKIRNCYAFETQHVTSSHRLNNCFNTFYIATVTTVTSYS